MSIKEEKMFYIRTLKIEEEIDETIMVMEVNLINKIGIKEDEVEEKEVN